MTRFTRKKRIYRDRLYVARQHPGLSGFVQRDKWEYSLVSGRAIHANRNSYDEILREYQQNDLDQFQWDFVNNRVVSAAEAVAEIRANRRSSALFLIQEGS